jgi:hypothetical protein
MVNSKSFILIGFLIMIGISFSQSKKEQIQILTARLDSLKSIQSNEKETFEKRSNELESSISKNHQKISQLLELHLTNKESLRLEIQEDQRLDQEILSLQSELNSIEDNIQAIIDDQPIKLLESSLFNISNEELIRLMNVSDEDLGESFINFQNPEIKPTYEIIGKQLYQLKGKVCCLVVMGVTNPNTSHASSGTNYIACFEIKDNNWRIEYPAFNTEFNPSSGFGIPAIFDKFVLFGDQNLALILEGGWVGMGYIAEYRAIYGLGINNEIHLIYAGLKEENDQLNRGTNYFQNFQDIYEISFQKSTNSKYYDFIETKKSHGKKVKTSVLKFNEKTMKYE